jgi:hypothetical protein
MFSLKLGRHLLQFFRSIQKYQLLSAVHFFQLFVINSKPWIRFRIGIQPTMLDPDLDPESINPNLKR